MGLNRHGVPRRPPANVRRALRKEALFGCVKCGFAFCEYEHIDPAFPDATEHDPARMAFLCKRCHGEITAGVASKESVWKAKAEPFCKRDKPAWKGNLEFGNLNSTLGTMTFHDCRVLLRVLGEDLLTIDPPEEDGGPIRVNARLFDGGTTPSLEIEDNAITIGGDNWDVEIVGDLLTVRRAAGEPSLIYRFVPGAGVQIERIAMNYKGVTIEVTPARVTIAGSGCQISAVHAVFSDCDTCIVATDDGFYFGDKPTRTTPFLGGHVVVDTCTVQGGLIVPSGSHVRLHGCWIDRGIKVEGHSTLEIASGIIQGVHPKRG